ncbi:MAG TPA: PQQ-binding-like beta-propeller repeat protein [Thermoanaerobaculia bacterium]|nr:PQQ-binding-like beta-propeller repeat protein [Thermoanaerobaculia bacterium]
MFATPTVVGDLIYVGACSGVFSAIDRSNGTPLWLYDISSDGDAREFHGNPVATKDRVFIPTDGQRIGHIYAFDRATGDVVWKYAHQGKDDSGFTSDVLLDDGHIIGVTVDERIVSLNAASGAEIWSFPIEARSRRVGMSAALANGRIFFGSSNGAVYAVDSQTGRQLWKTQLDAPASTAVAVSGKAIVVGTQGKKLYRLRASDGRVIGSLDLDVVPKDTPVMGTRGVYLMSEKEVLLVDANVTRVLWHADSKRQWTSPRPRIWHGWVVVGDRDGTVYALDEATGATVWSQNIHDKPIRGIGSDDSTLYVGTIDGHVIALRP